MTQEPYIDHRTLRELFRHLQAFCSLFETEGIDTITAPDGSDYNLFDLLRLYECRVFLSLRQRQAIELFLVEDLKEREVALRMGVSPASPVAIYATQGVKHLAGIYNSGFNLSGGSSGIEEPVQSDEAEVWGMPGSRRSGDRVDQAVA